jgi:hypothetical protein
MTVREMTELIGKTAELYVDSMMFRVQILDARTRFGATDVLITPDAGHGSGEKWVQLDRLSVIN